MCVSTKYLISGVNYLHMNEKNYVTFYKNR